MPFLDVADTFEYIFCVIIPIVQFYWYATGSISIQLV